MAIPGNQRQAAYVSRLRQGVAPVVKLVAPKPATTRKSRLAGIMADLAGLRDEYQAWEKGLPDNYSDISDANSDRLAEVQEFLEQVGEILDSLSELEAPRISLFPSRERHLRR